MDQPQDRRIVVGVDGSASSGEALRWAVRQARANGARVQAVASWEWPVATAGLAPYNPPVDLGSALRQASEELVAAVRKDEDLTDGVEVETVVIEGYPAQVLVEAARGADLLVVGSRGHGTLSGLLLGSVGLHCASHAPCPVVIVRGSASADS